MLKTRVTALVPESIAPDPDMTQKYEDSLDTQAGRVFNRLKAKLGTDAKFQSRVAGVAIPRYQPYVNPSFNSQKERNVEEILNMHRKKLTGAFPKWQRKVNLAFQTTDGVVAKRFKDAVAQGKISWQDAVTLTTLRLTGDKISGLGAVPIITYWAVGDDRAPGFLRAGDTADGAPFNFVRFGLKRSFKAGLAGRLVEAGVLIIVADYAPAEIASQNILTNTYCQSFIDPALGLTGFTSGGLTHLDYLYDAQGFKLELQINQM